jgi:hypothetical protein
VGEPRNPRRLPRVGDNCLGVSVVGRKLGRVWASMSVGAKSSAGHSVSLGP